ncbi:glycerophosphodiester phosphodiesterase [Myroides sp. LJL115]
MLRVGHRGAKGYIMENTIESIEKALELKCSMIEIDIHKTADNKLVVYHDSNLNRLTGKDALLSDFNLEQLQQFTLGDNYKIPTLQQVIEIIHKKAILNIEIKATDSLKELCSLLDYFFKQGYTPNNFIISSFDWLQLEQLSTMLENIPLAVLTQGDPILALPIAKELKAKAIHAHYKTLNQDNVRYIQDHHLKVLAYTVNSKKDISYIKNLKVDGIISDYPDRV